MGREKIEKMRYHLKQGYDIVSIGVILGVNIESLIMEALTPKHITAQEIEFVDGVHTRNGINWNGHTFDVNDVSYRLIKQLMQDKQ